MNFTDAKPRILELLRAEWGPDVELMTEFIIERPYGWVIVYNSREFIESGDINKAFISNTPFIYTKDGAVHYLNMAVPKEEAIRMTEVEHGLDPGTF